MTTSELRHVLSANDEENYEDIDALEDWELPLVDVPEEIWPSHVSPVYPFDEEDDLEVT